jgi:hypothetical protein
MFLFYLLNMKTLLTKKERLTNFYFPIFLSRKKPQDMYNPTASGCLPLSI